MSDSATERKLCISCKHHRAPQYALLQCVRPGLMQISPVDGEPHGKWAEWERAAFSEGCGPSGQFWENVK